MKGIVDIYTRSVYENFRPYYANWEPNRPIELGDIGTLDGRNFIRLDNIRGLFPEMSFATNDSKLSDTHRAITSKGATEVKFNAKAEVPAAGIVSPRANVEVTFSGPGAIFFNASGCQYVMIANKVALGQAIVAKFDEGKWEREWVVVTELVKSASVAIAVSGGNSASIVLAVEGRVEEIDLADAGVGLTVASSRNIGYQLVTSAEHVLLMALHKIQGIFPRLRYRAGPCAEGLEVKEMISFEQVT